MTNTASQSGNCSKSVLPTPWHPPKVETVQNQSFHDHHSLPKWKLFKISSFKTITHSLSVNYSKSVLSWQLQPPKVETVQNQFLSRPPHSPKVDNCSKSVLSRPPQPPKVEMVTNQFFQDHHNLPKSKWLKISSFKTTSVSQSRNCSKSVLSRPPHSLSKVETVQTQFFQDQHTLPK